MNKFDNIMKDKTGYFTNEEVAAMLNYCYDRSERYKTLASKMGDHWSKIWLRNYALLLTLINTGRRISEIVGQKPFVNVPGLRPMDFRGNNLIDFSILKKNQIKKRTKAGKLRNKDEILKKQLTKEHMRWMMPVTEDYYTFMQGYIKFINAQPHLRLFAFSRQRVDQIVKDIAKECMIYRDNTKIHVHQFRHTYAIQFLKGNDRNPMALIQLKELLKHSNMDITTTYTQFTQTDKKESLEQAFGGMMEEGEDDGQHENNGQRTGRKDEESE